MQSVLPHGTVQIVLPLPNEHFVGHFVNVHLMFSHHQEERHVCVLYNQHMECNDLGDLHELSTFIDLDGPGQHRIRAFLLPGPSSVTRTALAGLVSRCREFYHQCINDVFSSGRAFGCAAYA